MENFKNKLIENINNSPHFDSPTDVKISLNQLSIHWAGLAFVLTLRDPNKYFKKIDNFYFYYSKRKNATDDSKIDEMQLEKFTQIVQQTINQNEMLVPKEIDEASWDFNVFHKKENQEEIVELILRITKKCNQDCYFCFADLNNEVYSFNAVKETFNALRNLPVLKEKILSQYRIKISGGEPSIHPQFWEIIDYFYQQEIHVEIQTNAVYFAKVDFCEKIKYYPKLKFFISFHSHIEKAYNSITETKNQYKKAITGIQNIIKYSKDEIAINFVFTVENINTFSQYVNFIYETFEFKKHKEVKLHISILSRIENENIEKQIKYTEVINEINRAIPIFKKTKMSVKSISGSDCEIPLCVSQNLQTDLLFTQGIYKNISERTLFEISNTKFETCKKCVYDKNCPGIQKAYLTKFGPSEFTPVDKDLLKRMTS